jgi:Domain of unknown function (DUF1992)
VDAWAWIAEQRIVEAMADGLFDHLELSGRALDLEEAMAVPPDQRLAFKVLQNAGFVPPEVELRREIESLRKRLAAAATPAERALIGRQVNALVLKLNVMQRRPASSEAPQVVTDLAQG